jgi:hypothetical protein
MPRPTTLPLPPHLPFPIPRSFEIDPLLSEVGEVHGVWKRTGAPGGDVAVGHEDEGDDGDEVGEEEVGCEARQRAFRGGGGGWVAHGRERGAERESAKSWAIMDGGYSGPRFRQRKSGRT